MTIIAATDGSALGNPGPAAWAWYIDENCWARGGWRHGTNNMGELTAVLDLLRQTADLDDELLVLCDSTYAINAITKWMAGWKRKGWRKGDGSPVANLDIVKELDLAMQGRDVRFEWVKGHAGHRLNEMADRLANEAAAAFQQGRTPSAGPGFGPGAAPADDALFSLIGVTETTDEDEVVAAERALHSDEVGADPAALAALLHPQWTQIDAQGKVWERAGFLDAPASFPAADVEVVFTARLSADVFLVVSRWLDEHVPVLSSAVWERAGGGWRQRFRQSTVEG